MSGWPGCVCESLFCHASAGKGGSDGTRAPSQRPAHHRGACETILLIMMPVRRSPLELFHGSVSLFISRTLAGGRATPHWWAAVYVVWALRFHSKEAICLVTRPRSLCCRPRPSLLFSIPTRTKALCRVYIFFYRACLPVARAQACFFLATTRSSTPLVRRASVPGSAACLSTRVVVVDAGGSQKVCVRVLPRFPCGSVWWRGPFGLHVCQPFH